MSQLWLKILELAGYFRLPYFTYGNLSGLGNPSGNDALEGREWQKYLSVESLFRVWGPHQDSAWFPYHCLPLFASLDLFRKDSIGPASAAGFSADIPLDTPRPSWAAPESIIIVDLKGPDSVMVAAWLVSAANCQPVCTFDNWPNQRGLLKPERTLAALIRYACVIAEAKKTTALAGPPIWICDRERLGLFPGKPRDFDNRYYLDDSVLPGTATLKANGIQQIIYICETQAQVEIADLSKYFDDTLKAGIALNKVAIAGSVVSDPSRFEPAQVTFNSYGFFRSSAGGFGAPIPEPSSGGG